MLAKQPTFIALLWALVGGAVLLAPATATATSPTPAADGDAVLLHYTARVKDGPVFETTDSGPPRGIVTGASQVLPALERGLRGIRQGEKRQIEIPSAQAFGPYRDSDDMRTRIARNDIAHNLDIRVGARFNAAVFTAAGSTEPQHIPVTVVEVAADYIVVDANHPLAGKDLVFDVEAVEVMSATAP